MEDGDDQGGSVKAGQAEDIVVFAVDHPQAGMKVFQVAIPTLASGQGLDAVLESAGVAAGLGYPPLPTRVAQDLSQICIGGDGEDVG